MNKKDEIISSYYTEHLSVKEIANNFGVSSAYITKVIKQDARYIEEKQDRKNLSKDKRKIDQRNYIKNKREHQRIEDNYDTVIAQHNQATRELSDSRHISIRAYRKWNSSAYIYNPSKHRYEFDDTLGRSYAIPKYIKER